MDRIFYTKLISGCLNYNKIDYAFMFFEKSILQEIYIGTSVLNSIIEKMKYSNVQDKNEKICYLEHFKKPNGFQYNNELKEKNINSNLNIISNLNSNLTSNSNVKLNAKTNSNYEKKKIIIKEMIIKRIIKIIMKK